MWSKIVAGAAVKGENIIIGIVDGGIWPESPSYADQVNGSGTPVFSGGASVYGLPPAGWLGTCVTGVGFTPALQGDQDDLRLISVPEAIAAVGRPQVEQFTRDGALGSHLENLQRHGGFKGFNQKAVSAIISATDPRKQAQLHDQAA